MVRAGEIRGPHTDIAQPDQQRVVMDGELLTGGSAVIVAIRDPGSSAVVLYLECDPGRAIRVPEVELRAAAGVFRRWVGDDPR